MDVGHLSRDADLVAVEVVGLLAAFSVFVDVVLTGETAYVPRIPYVRIGDFMWATACLCYGLFLFNLIIFCSKCCTLDHSF